MSVLHLVTCRRIRSTISWVHAIHPSVHTRAIVLLACNLSGTVWASLQMDWIPPRQF
jgi:hypothetical protein